ncbi:hydroxyisourate hydrolase [Spongiactinospora sp. TRM90649]|uniref:hydroxyisourate hydrolase n=1 Tax=Spongiactinospora sp. TRM90649 TaxID=3031114 RepID=UPI0023F630EF|nr:hydroxyisourate hydrolase [Spongiactinospora sp. TRM90649]MDF5757185.1 hydroxyisourate hydrolase [Spongiactinospora sp. TRM90649]
MGVLDMSITAQALDSVYGRTAAGLRARLESVVDGVWHTVAAAETDSEGYIMEWHAARLDRGLYRIVFDSDHYFVGLGMNAAYPEITVMFRILDSVDSYQIQVTMSPYSYSTFFGSNS